MMTNTSPEFLLSQGFSPTMPERFWAKVNKTESCWLWTAFKNKKGYGNITRGLKPANGSRCRPIGAHVVSWILHNGPIPLGLCVLHNCPGGDNAACVNPDHLWLGTVLENNLDMLKKGRSTIPPHYLGEKNPASKITENDVREIRKLRAQGQSLTEIASRYPLSFSTISRICLRKTWSRVD